MTPKVFKQSFLVWKSLRSTRRSAHNLLKVPAPNSKLIKQSEKYRGSILNDAMISAAVLPEIVNSWIYEQIQLYYHKLESSFILNSPELIKLLFAYVCFYYELHQKYEQYLLSRYRYIAQSFEIGQLAFLRAVQHRKFQVFGFFFEEAEKLILTLSLQSFNSTCFVFSSWALRARKRIRRN